MSGWCWDEGSEEPPGTPGTPGAVVDVGKTGELFGSYPSAFMRSWAFCRTMAAAKAQVERRSGEGHRTRSIVLTMAGSTGFSASDMVSSVRRMPVRRYSTGGR